MTFADIAINDEFKDCDGVIYTKLSNSTASGPNWHWRKSGRYEFAADEDVSEFSRWKTP